MGAGRPVHGIPVHGIKEAKAKSGSVGAGRPVYGVPVHGVKERSILLPTHDGE